MIIKSNKKSPSTIQAEEEIRKPTVFYKTNVDEIIEVLKDNDENVWLIAAFENDGLDAIDFKHNMWGSYVDGSELYICVTDGHEIEVDGKMVDPEFALEDYGVEAVSPYIEDATPDIILERIGVDEINPPYFDGWAADLLEGGHSFVELMEAADDFID